MTDAVFSSLSMAVLLILNIVNFLLYSKKENEMRKECRDLLEE